MTRVLLAEDDALVREALSEMPRGGGVEVVAVASAVDALSAMLNGAPVPATTYYYRTTGGTRASTTDAGSIPAGAVVERVT